MANQKHLDLIKQSVTAFNAHRIENPDEEIDLSGANLYRADLSGANLYRADLSRADLRRADLYRADLSGAKLYRANLSGANLYRADLSRANLYGANLSRTILDPKRWAPPIKGLWDEACKERREALVTALRDGTALRGKWVDGTKMCLKGYLLDEPGKADAFTWAWDTHGITAGQVLEALGV